MHAIPVFGLERAIRLPRPSLIKRTLLPHGQDAPVEEVHRLAPVMDQYAIRPQGRVQVQGGGKRNEAWVLHTERGKLLLKRYKTTLTREQILHEHSILEHLEAAAFPAPRLVRDRVGSTVVEINSRFYVLFDYLSGYAHFDEYFYYPRQEHWLRDTVGRMLGLLHTALQGFSPSGANIHGFSPLTGQRERDLCWYLNLLAQAAETTTRLAPGEPLRALLDAKRGWLCEQLQAATEAIEAVNPERGIIHGDYGPNNMLFKPGVPPVVLDFELARTDWLLVDVVAALSKTCAKSGPPEEWARVLRGYLAERPIPADQLRLLPQVWQFQLLRRAIMCCGQYATQPRPELLDEAARRIRLAEAIGTRQSELAGLSELAGKPESTKTALPGLPVVSG